MRQLPIAGSDHRHQLVQQLQETDLIACAFHHETGDEVLVAVYTCKDRKKNLGCAHMNLTTKGPRGILHSGLAFIQEKGFKLPKKSDIEWYMPNANYLRNMVEKCMADLTDIDQFVQMCYKPSLGKQPWFFSGDYHSESFRFRVDPNNRPDYETLRRVARQRQLEIGQKLVVIRDVIIEVLAR